MSYRKGCLKLTNKLMNLITPGLKHSQDMYAKALNTVIINNETIWLDLGCGTRILPPWLLREETEIIDKCKKLIGIDYDIDSLKRNSFIKLLVRGEITKIPFTNNHFDVVTANMVVEHLEYPSSVFKEVKRILKPGGVFLIHTPNIYGYSSLLSRLVPEFIRDKIVFLMYGRKLKDIFETHYRANTVREIKKISKMVKMDIGNQRLVVSTPNLFTIPILLPIELMWIRLLLSKPFRQLRTSIISTLVKL